MTKFKFAALTSVVLLAATLAGCSSTPTAIERKLFTIQTNYLDMVQVKTQTVQQVVSVTNVINDHQVVVHDVTNFIPVTVQVTNKVEVQTLGPASAATTTATTIGSSIANVVEPGSGTILGLAVGGLLALWREIRNRKLKGDNNILTDASIALTQIVETAREVLSKTPQGKEVADKLTSWMISHQSETGTISAISQIVKDNVSETNAQAAAAQILGLIGDTNKKT